MKSSRYVILVFLFVFVGLMWFLQRDMGEPVTRDELLANIRQHHDQLVLDVRTPQEFITGHIPGAQNIPVEQLSGRLDELAEFRHKDVVLYCEVGSRSRMASRILHSAGFEKIYQLEGDMQAWRRMGFPQEGRKPVRVPLP